VTSSAGSVHVHGSWIDGALSGGVLQNNMTPGRANTVITTATTTDIIPAPDANVCRNVKTLHIRNADTSNTISVTVKHTDGTVAVELHSETLKAGESLEYIDGIGFFKLEMKATGTLLNASTADQSIGASTTAYLAGSSLVLPTNLKVGTVLRWTIQLEKTAAATATETIALRFGTTGTTSDTARNTFTGDTETAAADKAVDYIQAIIRGPIGSSCIVEAFWMRDHDLSTTGFSNTARKALVRQATSAAFDITPSGTIAGISIQTGASHALTVRQVVAEMLRP
jgi:hypothetical protein